MNFCQSIFTFLGQGNCVCRERKNISEAGLNLLDTDPQINQYLEYKDLPTHSPVHFDHQENGTVIINDVEAENKKLSFYEEEFTNLIEKIEINDSEVLVTKSEITDLETLLNPELNFSMQRADFVRSFKTESLLTRKLNLTEENFQIHDSKQQCVKSIEFLIETASNLDKTENEKSATEYVNNIKNLKCFTDGLSPKPEFFSKETEKTVKIQTELKKNSQLQEYEVKKLIASGSFSQVFLVQSSQTRNLFAMKTMKKSNIHKNNLLSYVLSEKKILSNFKYPFIIPLLASFQTPTHLMLLFPYCRNTLQDLLKSKLSNKTFLLYTCELALTIGFLHSKNILHRDIKPSNILINEDGHILLTDFGLAKDSLKAISFCGSFGYLAPEIESNKVYGKEVDWFMFGLVVFEMATGCSFFEEPEKIEGLEEKAKDFVKKLLEREPGRRLGALGDFEEVKRHEFFRNVCWDKVYGKVKDWKGLAF